MMNIVFLFQIITLILLLQTTPIDFKCTYKLPNQIVMGTHVDSFIPGHRVRRSISSNLRIHLHYMESFLSNPDSSVIQKELMEPSKIKLQSLLKVKNPVKGILRVDRTCINGKIRKSKNGIIGCSEGCEKDTKCSDVPIPLKYLKKCRIVTNEGDVEYSGKDGWGILNRDIIILVDFETCHDSTIASATSCFTENQLDRPILGVIQLCRGHFIAGVRVRENLRLIQHEIIHALGFALDKYAFFRYNDGTPMVPRDEFGMPNLGLDPEKKYYLWNDNIIKKVVRTRQSIHGYYTKEMNAFVLGNVVKVAREHFGCPHIDAVDIEDAGGFGTELTHFDEYFLFNEIMTPQSNNAVDAISKFTLALLKDTGWYDVDYSKAEDLEYGKRKGCTLPTKGCYSYMAEKKSKKQSLDPFCDTVLQYGNIARCSTKRDHFNYCQLTVFNEVKKENQYFSEIPGIADADVQYYTGSSELSEFCPMKIVFNTPNSVCNDVSNIGLTDKYNIIPSYYGNDSMCIESKLENERGNEFHGSSCQKYAIRQSKIQIFIGTKSFICPSKEITYFKLKNSLHVSFKCPENLDNILSKVMSPISQMSSYLILFILTIHYCIISSNPQ